MFKALLLMVLCGVSLTVKADMDCHGRFVNPISHIAWTTLFPLTIGGQTIADPENNKRTTPKEQKKVLCKCKVQVGPVKMPIPGVPLGLWQPYRQIDVTQKPYCMTSLGGMKMNLGVRAPRGEMISSPGKGVKDKAFYHAHIYVYPLLAWMNLFTSMACNSWDRQFDILYMTEMDPSWEDDQLGTWLSPESFIFSNPIATAACAADAAASTMGKPINGMFWCAGAQGNVYPLTGTLGHVESVVDAALQISNKLIFKLHREFLMWRHGGYKPLCKPKPAPFWKKNSYKLQMTYPDIVKKVGPLIEPSNPIGRTPWFWGANKGNVMINDDVGLHLYHRTHCCAVAGAIGD